MTGKISEKTESASLEDPVDSAMKIKRKPSSKVPSDTVFSNSDELEEEKEAIIYQDCSTDEMSIGDSDEASTAD